MFGAIFVVLGLTIFEVVNSIDNAVINAEVIGTMSPRGRRWFLLWGMLIAVFLVRGILPWIIVWLNSGLSLWQSLTATFTSDPVAMKAIESSAPILLLGAGVFLTLLFLHWLFMEDKHFGLPGERFVMKYSLWFYTVASITLAVIVWKAIHIKPMLAFGAVVGSTAFFLVVGFKQNAETMERRLLHHRNGSTDLSKILFLEVIDACFSVDGVLGAFAFTLSVPLILLGNGIGAVVVRQITIGNVERIKKLRFLKNGAMYSICALGLIMVADGFGAHIPEWFSPLVTFILIGSFLVKSITALREETGRSESLEA